MRQTYPLRSGNRTFSNKYWRNPETYRKTAFNMTHPCQHKQDHDRQRSIHLTLQRLPTRNKPTTFLSKQHSPTRGRLKRPLTQHLPMHTAPIKGPYFSALGDGDIRTVAQLTETRLAIKLGGKVWLADIVPVPYLGGRLRPLLRALARTKEIFNRCISGVGSWLVATVTDCATALD